MVKHLQRRNFHVGNMEKLAYSYRSTSDKPTMCVTHIDIALHIYELKSQDQPWLSSTWALVSVHVQLEVITYSFCPTQRSLLCVVINETAQTEYQ